GTMTEPPRPLREGLSERRARSTWLALGCVALVFVALVLLHRRLESQLSELSGALMQQRTDSDKLMALRNESRQTFVAILERWLKPPAERPLLRKPLEAMVEEVRQEAADFATLDPLDNDEAQRRDQLISDLAAWA